MGIGRTASGRGADTGRRDVAVLVRLAPAGAVAVGACAIAAQGSALLLPALCALVLDAVRDGGRTAGPLAALIATLVVQTLGDAGGGLARASATTRFTAALRRRFLRQVFALGIPGQRRYATGDLGARLVANTAVAASAGPMLVTAIVAGLTSIGGVIGLWLINWRLAAAFLIGVVPVVILLRRLLHRATGSYAQYLAWLGIIAARFTDALAGRRTIRASGTGSREAARILAPMPALADAGRRSWAIQRAVSWQIDLAMTVVRVIVLITAGIALARGRISPGDIVAAAVYLAIALNFTAQVDTVVRLSDARANADRVLAVLEEQPPVSQPPAHAGAVAVGRPGPTGPGAVSLRRVRVEMDGHRVLNDVSLDLPAGTALAVVGRSGGGKTTLALVAGQLLTPDAGEVLVDGVPGGGPADASPGRTVSYAFDRPVLLGTTVREALSYGRPGASESEIMQAMEMAQAGEFIRRLPGGLDAPLATAPFSGGELQRLGLARALVHSGGLLVLDDAMSSLDTATEVKVTNAVTKGLARYTRLIVAHRASTAAAADLVAWLEEGRIRAVAPHRLLWSTEPEYRDLFAIAPADETRSRRSGIPA